MCMSPRAGWVVSSPGIEPALVAAVHSMVADSRNFRMQERPGGGSVRVSMLRPADYMLL